MSDRTDADWANWKPGDFEQEMAVRHKKEPAKPTVYLFVDGASIGISSYPSDHEDAEKYTMDVQEFQVGRDIHPEISITVLRNILAQAGVQVVIE